MFGLTRHLSVDMFLKYVTCLSILIDWAQAIRIGVLDCAYEKNFDICKEFGIHFYPTFRVCLCLLFIRSTD